MGKRFELKEEHIKLLSSAYVSWHYSEYGAPCIDGKRPYGNGDVERDVLEILGIELQEDRYGEIIITKEQAEWAGKLHSETQTALQIILRNKSFEPGIYEEESYFKWKKIN